jgi:hypothetical protein
MPSQERTAPPLAQGTPPSERASDSSRETSTPEGPGAAFDRLRPWVLALSVAVPIALAYLALAPVSADLAAASYRSYLFAHFGLTLWDNGWYGGHHLLAYSLLSPALGAPLGPRLPQAISTVLASVLFASLIADRFPPRAVRVGSVWFALGVSIELLSGRVPFDIGLAIGLGALLAARHRLRGTALCLAVLSSLASPVAGAFLALACLVWALGGDTRRERLHIRRLYASSASRFIESHEREAVPVGRLFRVSLGASALVVIAASTLLFPEGGSEPFVASSFWPAEALTLLLCVLLPAERRVLRVGALLYGAALLAAFLLPTAVGGNAVRLGALLAGPLAACALLGTGNRVLLVLAPFLLYWQLVAPVRDVVSASSDPAVRASYYAPLLEQLHSLGALGSTAPTRIEVVPTRDHWEARWLAPHIALARGWERQLDRADNGLFYGSRTLTPSRYETWLESQSISYVALPDAPLDSSGKAEAKLLATAHLGYLREIWHSRHWRLFAVLAAQPLARGGATLRHMSSDGFALTVPHPGAFEVHIHFTRYWALESPGGCVSEGRGDWTLLRAKRAGYFRIGIDFALDRVFSDGPRCR